MGLQDEAVHIRMNTKLLDQIDALTNPLLGTKRSDVIRSLLVFALNNRDAGEGKSALDFSME